MIGRGRFDLFLDFVGFYRICQWILLCIETKEAIRCDFNFRQIVSQDENRQIELLKNFDLVDLSKFTKYVGDIKYRNRKKVSDKRNHLCLFANK